MSQEPGQDALPTLRPDPPPSRPGAHPADEPGAPSAPWASPAGPSEYDAVGVAAVAPVPQSARWQSPRPVLPGTPPAGSGGIPLRPLDVGDVLDGTFGVVRRNPRATLLLAALLVSLQQLLVLLAEFATGDLPSPVGVTFGSTSAEAGSAVGLLVGLALSAVVGAVLTAMIVVVVAEDLLGRRATVSQVWSRVRPRLWALLAAAVVVGIVPYLGLLLFVVPGVILWGCWALTTPALILEGLGPIQAMRRSWRLAWPDFFRVWGIRALSVLLGTVMQGVLALPFLVVSVALSTASDDGARRPLLVLAIALGVVGGIVAGTVTQPFLAGVLVLLYTDRRMRSEGLDIVLQLRIHRGQRTPGARPSVGPPAGQPPVDAQLASWGGVPATGHASPGTGRP